MIFAVIAHCATRTNLSLVIPPWLGAESALLTPEEALAVLGPGDVALGRLDVRPTLDGVDDGLGALAELAHRGVRVLNGPRTLLAAHDKLLTARELGYAGLPHPGTAVYTEGDPIPQFEGPVVVKPRFGSWGADVLRCDDEASFERCLAGLSERPWFPAHGALVQTLVTPLGWDLRLIVAGGRVVGAISRVARPGEWRTNVALGAVRRSVTPPAAACALAVAAAEAVDGHLIGVDLLPTPAGGYIVLELNGAADFTQAYSLDGEDVYASAILALADQTTSVVTALLPHTPETDEVVTDDALGAVEQPPAS